MVSFYKKTTSNILTNGGILHASVFNKRARMSIITASIPSCTGRSNQCNNETKGIKFAKKKVKVIIQG